MLNDNFFACDEASNYSERFGQCADLHVDTLDATFRDCLTPVRAAFRAMYPKLIRPSRLVVTRPVANRHRKQGYGLLFSGGVDSTASFYKNLARRPTLIMVDGVDPPWLVQRDWDVPRAAFCHSSAVGRRLFAQAA